MIQTSTTEPQTFVAWHTTVPGGRLDHLVAFTADQTAGGYVDFVSILPRILCHALVTRMPEEGLPELCSTLGEMYKFYADRNIVNANPVKRLVGRVRESRERDAFVVDED